MNYDEEILKLLKQCREMLALVFFALIVVGIILMWINKSQGQEFDTRDEYYRENVDSDYFDTYFSHYYQDYPDDECCNDEFSREEEKRYERREYDRRRFREDYKNFLRDEGVEEGMLVGW